MSISSISPRASASPIGLAPNAAKQAIGCGTTKLYELLAAGELESYCVGRSRRITVASIEAYVARQLEQAKAA
jgi:excisionase family DNA binding protein